MVGCEILNVDVLLLVESIERLVEPLLRPGDASLGPWSRKSSRYCFAIRVFLEFDRLLVVRLDEIIEVLERLPLWVANCGHLHLQLNVEPFFEGVGARADNVDDLFLLQLALPLLV